MSQGYCSTNLLTQEVSQHIALYDAQSARFPKFLSGLNEPVPLFLIFTEDFFCYRDAGSGIFAVIVRTDGFGVLFGQYGTTDEDFHG